MHNALIIGMYLAGQFVSLLMRADLSASLKTTPWNSVYQYYKQNQAEVTNRLFISTCLFGVWGESPKLLDHFGYPVSTALPMLPSTAGLYGVMSDKLVNYVMEKFHSKIGG